MSNFFKEFKEFAMKGNVMDMAVGVIIGGAFGKIISSLVDDVLMPLVSLVTGGVDFTGLVAKLGEDEHAAVLKYGVFIQNVIDFLIVALCIFLMIKAMNRLMRKKAEEPAPAQPTAEEKLLTEIRDLMKAGK